MKKEVVIQGIILSKNIKMAKRGTDRLVVITEDIIITLQAIHDSDMAEIIGPRNTDIIIILVRIGNEDKRNERKGTRWAIGKIFRKQSDVGRLRQL